MKRKNLNVAKLKNTIYKDKKISKIYSKLNSATKNIKTFLAAISGPIQLIIYGTNKHSLYSTYLFLLHLIIFVISLFMFKNFNLITAPMAIIVMELFTVIFAISFTAKIMNLSSFAILINSIKLPKLKKLILFSKLILNNYRKKIKI